MTKKAPKPGETAKEKNLNKGKGHDTTPARGGRDQN